MRVLLAFDKFKDALTAQAAVAVAADAVQAAQPDWTIDACPLADGGEGMAEILTHSAQGEWREHTVTGPRGAPVKAGFGLVAVKNISAAARAMLGLASATEGNVAVLAMASASGLALLTPDQRDPWHTTSRGTGELIQAAAATGAVAIIVGVGGSATHDVGLGALSVLGLTFHPTEGAAIASPVPATWASLARVSGKIQPDLPPLFVACDVTNPLMGTFGAASVFAPQKGLLEEDFTRLEYMTGRMAALLAGHAGKPPLLCDTPSSGAAGGLAFGLMCSANASLVRGFDLVAAWLDLDQRIAAADLVFTGEGCFDATSLEGKGPGGIVARARAAGKPVHVFAGSVQTAADGVDLHTITPEGQALPAALTQAAANLRRAVRAAVASA